MRLAASVPGGIKGKYRLSASDRSQRTRQPTTPPNATATIELSKCGCALTDRIAEIVIALVERIKVPGGSRNEKKAHQNRVAGAQGSRITGPRCVGGFAVLSAGLPLRDVARQGGRSLGRRRKPFF